MYGSEMYLRKVEPRPDPVSAEVVALAGNALVGYKEAMPEVVRIWGVESKSSYRLMPRLLVCKRPIIAEKLCSC